jgi:hypothetical protein
MPPDSDRGHPHREDSPNNRNIADTNNDSSTVPRGRSRLRQALDDVITAEAKSQKLSLKDLTVLALQHDPFRLDTPANQRDGEWLAVTAGELGLANRKIHLRGLHYMVIGWPKPDGLPYTNTDADWLCLSGSCGKAGRFLGYIPFDQVVDQRNAEPAVRIFRPSVPWHFLNVGIEADIRDAATIEPKVGALGFDARQAYKLVLVGEKSSLEDVLGPIAQSHGADLYLPTGEISDTLGHQMAKIGAQGGRPMVVFYFTDCDPAGHQMSVSVSRKLQALKAGLYPEPEFQVHRVALTPDQVQEYGLPSTPLEETEKPAGAWQAAMGVEQTEIESPAALRPDLLRQLARDAIAPFYDHDLHNRVTQGWRQCVHQAQAVVDTTIDQDQLARLRAEAQAKLAELREEIDAINHALQLDVVDLDLPPIVVPKADLSGKTHPLPLLDSRWSFAEQCRRLIDSKAYRLGDPK